MMALRRRLRPVALLVAAALWSSPRLRAQAQPRDASATGPLYHRLLEEISQIPIIDNHAHPGLPDDSDVDAMVLPPGSTTILRLRDSNPELLAADRALFGYPYSNFSPEHVRWLEQKKAELRRTLGNQYFSHILDLVGVQYELANRVAMPDYLDPKRFRWVCFADSFLFPFNNRAPEARSPDNAVYIPLQEKVLHRYLQQAGLARIPDSLDGYEGFIRRVLEQNQRKGAVAVKFEVAYFRPLHFSDPPRSRALAIYNKYRAGGAPTAGEYLVFQDYIFRYLIRQAGSLHLAVHFHSAVGVGNYFNLTEDNVMNLENVLRDPRYHDITFVLLHGGYPLEREAIWLAAMPNVYLDSSLMELFMYPWQFRISLREWLELYPERVMFGSDAFPFGEGLGVEEILWLGVNSARESLAADLAEMVDEHEMSEGQALDLARDYLHDNATRLYGLH